MPTPEPTPPGPGQESVWDYPRPPRLELRSERIEVWLGGRLVAATEAPMRVLETSHPPTYYLPVADFAEGALRATPGGSFCEWKGQASYVDVVGGEPGAEVLAPRAGWYYPSPTAPFAAIVDHVAVYPAMMQRCTLDGEPVTAQPGGFYGGWVTDRVVGPFKGEPGTMGW